MKRDPSIELFRVLMMFGIVLLHVCQMTPGHWPNNVLVSCVSGFVLISGYFYAVGSAVDLCLKKIWSKVCHERR